MAGRPVQNLFQAREAVGLIGSIAVALALFMGAECGALAQQNAALRLPLASSAALPRDGTYVAGDRLSFVVDHLEGRPRLRFSGSDEVFYLTSEAAPLGGRVLKYDTGAVALQVTGWGGVTLYTANAKSGLPAEYTDVVQNVDPPPVLPKDVKAFAQKFANELASHEDFAIGFAADWDQMEISEGVRMLACDAMRNATYALQALAHNGRRNLLADRFHIVRVIQGMKAGVTVQKGILAITIAPQSGLAGRPSSLTISRALQAAL